MRIPSFLMLAGSFLIVLSARAALIPIYGTGVSNGGGLLADGVQDPHYSLSSLDAQYQGPAAFVSSEADYPLVSGPWVADGTTSKWISPNANPSIGLKVIDYSYTTTFDLTGFDLTTAELKGLVAADDSVKIVLNGTAIYSTYAGYTKFSPIDIDRGFVGGKNVLTFAVTNSGGGPTGLNVSMMGTATSTPEPGTIFSIAGGTAVIGLGFLIKKRAAARNGRSV